MKDHNFKFKLIRWHFYLLVFILLNFFVYNITDFRINQNFTFYLKIVLYLSGIVLFFKLLKPFKLMAIYFSFYTISVVLIGLAFKIGGIFLTILVSFLLFPIHFEKIKYKTETIKIYDRYKGIMSSCCSYEVVEPKLYLFEKHLGFIDIEKPIDANKDQFRLHNNTIIYKFEKENYNYENQTKEIRDTTVILNFK